MSARAALVPLSLVAALLSGCSGDGDASSLGSVTWVLDAASIGSLGVADPPAGARIDLRFDDGELSGRAACNSYGGSYQADGNALAVGAMSMTEMACDEPLMALEAAYLAELAQVDAFQVVGDGAGLVLTGGRVALTYRAESA